MRNVYITKQIGGILRCFYHSAENGICLRVFDGGKWRPPVALALDARESFSVSLGKSGKTYILYKDIDGNLKLCSNQAQAGGFTAKIVIPAEKAADLTAFYTVPSDKGDYIIYNESGSSENHEAIVSRRLTASGGLAGTEKLDRFGGLSGGWLSLQTVKDDHALLFYQAKKPEAVIGYREITLNETSEFNAVHISRTPAVGYSLLTAADSVHFLYIIRNAFSYKLIYRKRHAEGMTPAILIAEAQTLENCLLTIAGGKLHAFFIMNGYLYSSVSANGGLTFARPERYRSKFCQTPVKAGFLFEAPPDTEDWFAREVYVDAYNPWDIQILPDICEDFYSFAAPALPPEPAPRQNQNTPAALELNTPIARKPPAQTEAEAYYGTDTDDMPKLLNRIELLEKQLREKDRQLMNFVSSAESGTQSYAALNSEWKSKYDRLTRENAALNKEIQTQKNVIENYFAKNGDEKSPPSSITE